jgi:hypothetical protein
MYWRRQGGAWRFRGDFGHEGGRMLARTGPLYPREMEDGVFFVLTAYSFE